MPQRLKTVAHSLLNIQVGRDDAIGIFHLLNGDSKLPTEKTPDGIDPDSMEQSRK